jgi:hypothetical protein
MGVIHRHKFLCEGIQKPTFTATKFLCEGIQKTYLHRHEISMPRHTKTYLMFDSLLWPGEQVLHFTGHSFAANKPYANPIDCASFTIAS